MNSDGGMFGPYPPAMDMDDARRGGWMNPRANPLAVAAALFERVGRTRTESDRRAFQKRVAKRRAKKGYR